MRVPLRLVISVQQRVLSEGSAGRTRQHMRTVCGCASAMSPRQMPDAGEVVPAADGFPCQRRCWGLLIWAVRDPTSPPRLASLLLGAVSD
jgi:hypothetical protein